VRHRATCANHLTIRRDDVEKAILRRLKTRLMDPSLFEEFAREFIAEVKRQRSAGSAAKEEFAAASSGRAAVDSGDWRLLRGYSGDRTWSRTPITAMP
jgi:hypothetical protein